MREKHKKMIDENELLKTKLREANGTCSKFFKSIFLIKITVIFCFYLILQILNS